MNRSRLLFDVVTTETVVVARLAGELDASTADVLRRRAPVPSLGELVVLDLTAVGFCDSAGLGALLGVVRRARERDGRVAIVTQGGQLRRLLDVVGLSRVVPVAASVDDAVAPFLADTAR